MQPKNKSYLFLAIVLVLAGLSTYYFLQNQKNINYGLDVKGGSRITYSMDLSGLKPELKAKAPEYRTRLIPILEQRISALGVAEGSVQPKGELDINVEIPGQTDLNKAREILGKTAKIQFFDAKTVQTERNKFRRYQDAHQPEKIGNKEVVTFIDTLNPGKVIKPGTPEYLQVIKSWGEPIVEGDDLAEARQSMRGANQVIPEMRWSSAGSTKMREWSTLNQNTREGIAAVLENEVISLAYLEDGAILDQGTVITGNFSAEYVSSLVNLLNSGSLPVPLMEASSQTVSPTIGAGAKDVMIQAGLICFALIAVFMLAYYRFPGFVAIIALALYIVFTVSALIFIGATFSLAAIAGLILSVGMAVDANILVYERLKEEMRSGKPLLQAVEVGFKRSLSAIFDSNMCSIITCLVLYKLGSGPVKGFAFTLGLGVAISLLTAVVVTRSLLIFLVGSGIGANPKWYNLGAQWMSHDKQGHDKTLNIVGRSGRYFGIAALIGVVSIGCIAMGGLKPNVEFRGGYELVFNMEGKNLSQQQIEGNLVKAGIKGANVKLAEEKGKKTAILNLPISSAVKQGDAASEAKLFQVLGFTEADKLSFTSVGPSMQKEAIDNAVKGVVISIALIIMWLAFRFGYGGIKNGFKFATSAVLALIFNTLAVVGSAALAGLLFGWEISTLFITAMLTVIGFSVHDTIVIFDRIRENLKRVAKGDNFEHLCNVSSTQTMARSINTALTVVLSLFILLLIGAPTEDLKLFCFTMLIGIIVGTYSSIFNATPILFIWDRAIEKSKGAEATLIADSLRERAKAKAHSMTIESAAPGTPTSTYGQVKRRDRSRSSVGRTLDDDN